MKIQRVLVCKSCGGANSGSLPVTEFDDCAYCAKSLYKNWKKQKRGNKNGNSKLNKKRNSNDNK